MVNGFQAHTHTDTCTRARRGKKGERASKLARTKDSVSLFTAVYLNTQMRKKDCIALKQEAQSDST